MITNRGINKFVSISGIKSDLLNSSSPRALDCNNIALSREKILILEVFQGKPFRVVDESADIKEIGIFINFRYPSVISNEM